MPTPRPTRPATMIKLTTGVEIGFAPRDVEGLQHASTDDLKAVELEAFGLGIHFPTIDADLYVPALLEGSVGVHTVDGSPARGGGRANSQRGKGRCFA